MSVTRLTEIYEATPDTVRIAGRGWYPQAAREAKRIATMCPPGIGPISGAGIIAALSPRAQWSVNLRWAEELALDATTGATSPPRVGLPDARAKAWRIATGGGATTVLRGDKVRSFWRNLCGSADDVTLDVWALRAIGLDYKVLGRKGEYDRIASLYRGAAQRVGERACDFQAIIWLAIRGDKPADPAAYRTEAA